MSQRAAMTGMCFFLFLFAVCGFFLARNQSLFSILASVFHKRAMPNARTTIWLATGSPDGSYYALGQAIAEIGRTQGINISVCTTRGSYDNIGLLEEGSVSLALAQIDALDAVVVHNKPAEISSGFKDDAEGCKRLLESKRTAKKPLLVTYLYSEMVHMILRPHFYIGSLADLKQDSKHVWLGPSGSGSRATTERLLQASGIVKGDIDRWFSYGDTTRGQSSMD